MYSENNWVILKMLWSLDVKYFGYGKYNVNMAQRLIVEHWSNGYIINQ